jgi:hypothetical protein
MEKTSGIYSARFCERENSRQKPNVIKLRKTGLHKNVRSSFFVTISELMLDK